MTDVNHQVSKALVVRYGAKTLFVLESDGDSRSNGAGPATGSVYVRVVGILPIPPDDRI